MKLLLAFLMTAVIVVAACAPQPQQPLQPQENKTETVECVADSDCGVGGCSGQVCATASEAAGIITTCEYREEYGCLKLTSCGCVSGRCEWIENPLFEKCVQQSKDKKTVY